MNNLSVKEFGAGLNKLVVYRNLLKDPVFTILKKLIDEVCLANGNKDEIINLYYELNYNLISCSEKSGLNGNLLKSYIIDSIIKSKNFFTKACEKYGSNLEISLYSAALNDMEILYNLTKLDLKNILDLDDSLTQNYIPTLTKTSISMFKNQNASIINSNSPKEMLSNVIKYYSEIGSGEMSNHIAFMWKDGLVGVKDYDYVEFSDIVGYEYQKETLIKNTEAFVSGRSANNVLLIGARGTGKSSSVKALVTEYYEKGLRLIEITKNQLLCFPEILAELKSRGKYFIVFIDDLSFEEGEIEYKQMKSFLDGGIEKVPSNVLVYATSNRRHLIKETWGDRNQVGEEEIHSSDTVNEKLSLSDRFGIKLTYISPSQNEYFNIVEELAKKHNLNIPVETLRSEAVKWAASQNGRSGRTAKQFINSLFK